MDDEKLLRYSRQIMLPSIGIEGQQRLLDARVLVVGAGGLGCAALLYLAGAGVGRITLADADTVDLSNLQRQVLYRQEDIGRAKVEAARERLAALNPDIRLHPLRVRLRGQALADEIARADLVLDASDNFDTRFDINRCCVNARVPLVSGAAIRMEGQVAVFDPRRETSPCYHCLYREGEEPDSRCTDNGILAPVVGIIGAMQALEAIKLILGAGDALCGHLLLFDALHAQWRDIRLKPDPGCPVCGAPPT